MPPKKRTSGRLPEVRTTPAVDEALLLLQETYPDLAISEIIRRAIIEYSKRKPKK